MLRKLALPAVLTATALFAGNANAVLEFDEDVTNEVIMGSGIGNGGWTVERADGVEVGLRAKQRFPPANVFNSNGDGTYNFPAGNDAGRPLWSFEWSINTDHDDTTGLDLDDLTYALRLDSNPTSDAGFSVFDPINIPATSVPDFADHSIGDNSTAESAGTEAGDRPTYLGLINTNNLAQNSWRMDFFFPAPLGPAFDPDADGTYEFELAAFNANGDEVAATAITVIVGEGGVVLPEPATAALAGLSVLGLGSYTRRRR